MQTYLGEGNYIGRFFFGERFSTEYFSMRREVSGVKISRGYFTWREFAKFPIRNSFYSSYFFASQLTYRGNYQQAWICFTVFLWEREGFSTALIFQRKISMGEILHKRTFRGRSFLLGREFQKIFPQKQDFLIGLKGMAFRMKPHSKETFLGRIFSKEFSGRNLMRGWIYSGEFYTRETSQGGIF